MSAAAAALSQRTGHEQWKHRGVLAFRPIVYSLSIYGNISRASPRDLRSSREILTYPLGSISSPGSAWHLHGRLGDGDPCAELASAVA